MFCTAFEERDMHRFRIFFETTPFCHAIRIIPVIKRLRNLGQIQFFAKSSSINTKICLRHCEAQDLLEKLVEILLYNFHREYNLLKLKIKKLLRKIKSKNFTARV